MADLLYLSYWLKEFNERNMLRALERALLRFPFSASSPGITMLRIYAVQYAEPSLLETFYDPPAGVETVLRAAAEFRSSDCAYLVGGYWDLWHWDGGWRLAPTPIQVGCYGQDFENEEKDNLRVELGLDSHFLPRPELAGSESKVQSNLRSVLRLAGDLDQVLPVSKRRLWTESGEDFLQHLRSLVG